MPGICRYVNRPFRKNRGCGKVRVVNPVCFITVPRLQLLSLQKWTILPTACPRHSTGTFAKLEPLNNENRCIYRPISGSSSWPHNFFWTPARKSLRTAVYIDYATAASSDQLMDLAGDTGILATDGRLCVLQLVVTPQKVVYLYVVTEQTACWIRAGAPPCGLLGGWKRIPIESGT